MRAYEEEDAASERGAGSRQLRARPSEASLTRLAAGVLSSADIT